MILEIQKKITLELNSFKNIYKLHRFKYYFSILFHVFCGIYCKKYIISFFKEELILSAQMEQLQESFKTIEREIVSKIWKLCKENLEEATMNNSRTTTEFMKVLEAFGSVMSKRTILDTWKQPKQIYLDTMTELEEISSTCDVNKIEESKEEKIMREMCLHIFWNMLAHPTITKYRQINTESFRRILGNKCDRLGVNVNNLFVYMQAAFKGMWIPTRN
ncbi:hypothetical protein RFI_10547 [Reticulomyxa filosa]|uniref:Uncharacterized protein n=1 Tax=Reticulomyxa filosa TaxID=46433 RepID=X6NKY8_RETFI|nr:hypothetical protein RFI_10547 [Reticulomyxa filosa]|eukprot:ETO26588.1 hypothetical protein RFI_10547 [Reticulomyxa filosa]